MFSIISVTYLKGGVKKNTRTHFFVDKRLEWMNPLDDVSQVATVH